MIWIPDIVQSVAWFLIGFIVRGLTREHGRYLEHIRAQARREAFFSFNAAMNEFADNMAKDERSARDIMKQRMRDELQ